MSASLVGSEMCIRDRPSRLHSSPTSGSVEDPALLQSVPESEGSAPRVADCLLYTSDAADDM
eukprot:363439-Alexandrium_andersonii.AAC.1